jgi:dienelactone hydrolase
LRCVPRPSPPPFHESDFQFTAGQHLRASYFSSQGVFAQAEPKKVGVVLIHGKWGNPNGNTKSLGVALKSNGYVVATPLMTWSTKRGYEKP